MADKKDPQKRTGEAKTTPSARKNADENTFAKDYLAYVDDSKNVPNAVHEANKVDAEQSALQRGLRPTGEAKLKDSKVKDAHNVLLTYTVPVEPNTL